MFSTLSRRLTSRASRSLSGASGTFRPEPQAAESLIQIGTRGIFEQEHDMYRELCRSFYAKHVIPHHAGWEEKGEISRECWLEAGKQGLLCVTMPEKYGGPGLDILYAAVNWEEQSYANTSGPGWSLHSEIVAPYILHYGTEEQKMNYLPRMTSGECIGAIAMTEPGAGSDLQGMRTTAVKSGDDYIINGSKTYITNGALADVVIVCAKTDVNAKGSRGITLFLVDTNTPGFKKGKKLKKVGLKAQDTSELFFEDMRVPKSAVLGEVGKGFAYLMTELPQERLLVADNGIAVAEAAYEWTRSWCKDRKAFGSTISNLQTVKHKLAELKTEIVIGRTFADQCILMHKQGRLDNQTASMAKYWLTDLQGKVVDQCLQLHGGAGYMWEYNIGRAFADARVARIYAGSNEIMKELIARSI